MSSITQLAVTGPPNSPPKDGIHPSKSFLEGKPNNPQDTERNLHPVVTELPSTNPYEGISTSHPLPEWASTDPKDLGSNIQLINRGLPFTTGSDQSWSGIKYQVKHEDDATSNADLRAAVEECAKENDDKRNQTTTTINTTTEFI
ncbi:hypothetical protein Tco_1253995 [Tanacetum coccineum]